MSESKKTAKKKPSKSRATKGAKKSASAAIEMRGTGGGGALREHAYLEILQRGVDDARTRRGAQKAESSARKTELRRLREVLQKRRAAAMEQEAFAVTEPSESEATSVSSN